MISEVPAWVDMCKLTESRNELNDVLKIIERHEIMNCVVPPAELTDHLAVVDFFTILPMGPNRANPIHSVLGGSRESGVRLPSQLALQGLDPVGPVLRVLDFDNQDRPECERRCRYLDDLDNKVGECGSGRRLGGTVEA